MIRNGIQRSDISCPIGKWPVLPYPVAKPFNRSDEVALITTHFNVAGFKSRTDTYAKWLPHLGSLAESLHTTELVFNDDPPAIATAEHLPGTRSANALWQKERLINRTVQRLPPSIRYVAWLDNDIIIDQPDWLALSVEKLDAGADAVQLFSKLDYLDKTLSRIQRSKAGAVANRMTKGKGGQPGGAWIAKRELLDRIGGLPERCIVGAGDQAFFHAMMGDQDPKYLTRLPTSLASQLRSWIQSVGNVAVDYLDCRAVHIWHGADVNRQHRTRQQILTHHGFDPDADLLVDAKGLLSWSDNARPELIAAVKSYFKNRREDDPPPPQNPRV
jgi:hypothetical protein